MNRLQYLPQIDVLRALAVIGVIFYHYAEKFVPSGYVGVDVFFVISGYLITKNLLAERANPFALLLKFTQNRILRIFPALVPVFLFVVIFSWIFLQPDELVNFGNSLTSAALFITNISLSKEIGYFTVGVEKRFLLHLWSLGVEEQFYLFWPILLLFIRSKKVLYPVILLLFIVSIIHTFSVTEANVVDAFYLPQWRLWEFVFGAFLLYLQSRVSFQENVAFYIQIISIATIIISFFAIPRSVLYPYFWSLIPTVGALLFLLSSFNIAKPIRIFDSLILNFVGKISYSLYLWHWVVFVAYIYIYRVKPGLIESSILFIIVLILASLSYLYIERRFKNIRNRNAVTATLLCIFGLFAILGMYLVKSNGIPDRYPSIIYSYSSLTQDNDYYPEMQLNDSCIQYRNQEFCSFSAGKTKILVWGDSHAAALYQGFKSFAALNNISIFKSSGCGNPPFVSISKLLDYWCGSSETRFDQNLKTLEYVKEINPDLVILHSRWAYDKYDMDINEVASKIVEAVNSIKLINKNIQVLVYGPVPNWIDTLPHAIVDYWKQSRPHVIPPNYMTFHNDRSIGEYDQSLRLILSMSNVNYISAYDIFCSDKGCLTRLNDDPKSLTTYDYGHLSKPGANYLIKETSEKLLKNLSPSYRPN